MLTSYNQIYKIMESTVWKSFHHYHQIEKTNKKMNTITYLKSAFEYVIRTWTNNSA